MWDNKLFTNNMPANYESFVYSLRSPSFSSKRPTLLDGYAKPRSFLSA